MPTALIVPLACLTTIVMSSPARPQPGSADKPAPPPVPEADPEVQAALDALTSAFVTLRPRSPDAPELQEALAPLRAMRRAGKNIVVQFMLHARRGILVEDRRTSLENGQIAYYTWMIVVSGLYSKDGEPDRAALITDVAPAVGTVDSMLAQAALRVVRTATRRGGGFTFAPLVPILGSRRDSPPAWLLDYAFSAAPVEAAHAMTDACLPRGAQRERLIEALRVFPGRGPDDPVRLTPPAPEDLSRRVRILEDLSRWDIWWVRLFAKAMFATQSEYTYNATRHSVLFRLDDDPDERVRGMFRVIPRAEPPPASPRPSL